MSTPAKILGVDDTPHTVKLLADILGMKGYVVSTATNGAEALAKVAADAPDLILLDIMMPGLSGYDVCSRLRADPATRTEGNPYAAWIDVYTSPDYVAVAARAIEAMDRMGQARGADARYADLLATFRAASRLEAAFWDMGWSVKC